MTNLKKNAIFVGILLSNIFLIFFVRNALYPIHYAPQGLFFLELMGITIHIPFELLLLIETGNIVLLFLISKKLFPNKFSLIAPMIYAVSPWSIYLVSGESFYIYLSFLIQVYFYGLLLKSEKKFLGLVFITIAAIIGAYTSLFLLILLPSILCLIIFFRIYNFKYLKLSFVILSLSISPLLFLILSNQLSFKNILNKQIQIFSDPGLLNMVNDFQGAAKQENLGKLAKISENKYLFFSEFFLLKMTKQFTPSTYFTSQEKLLNFSFSPPIYLGFLIPFFFGLYKILKSASLQRILFLSSIIVIPSVLAKEAVDLNRLILFAPVVILLISYGFTELIKQKEKKVISMFLIISISLVIFQFLTTVFDIQSREKNRFIKYNMQNYEIGNQ